MAFAAEYDIGYWLDAELAAAAAPSAALFEKIVAKTSRRLPALRQQGGARQLSSLIAAGAWTEAALALVAIELPSWQLRRLVYDDGEWLCALSHMPNLPLSLDDTADGAHPSMPLSVLRAFVQARGMIAATPPALRSVPHIAPAPDMLVCCDNFS